MSNENSESRSGSSEQSDWLDRANKAASLALAAFDLTERATALKARKPDPSISRPADLYLQKAEAEFKVLVSRTEEITDEEIETILHKMLSLYVLALEYIENIGYGMVYNTAYIHGQIALTLAELDRTEEAKKHLEAGIKAANFFGHKEFARYLVGRYSKLI